MVFLGSFSSSLLCYSSGLVERVPEYSGKWFEDARERFALRCLQDVLDSGIHARVDASGGARAVDVGLDDSCEDAVS